MENNLCLLTLSLVLVLIAGCTEKQEELELINCDEIEDIQQKDECYLGNAAESKNPSVCENISANVAVVRRICYQDIAIQTKNINQVHNHRKARGNLEIKIRTFKKVLISSRKSEDTLL